MSEQGTSLIASFPLRDTSVHSYRTDPTYFSFVNLFPSIPSYDVFGIWVYNTTDQTINVQLIGNTIGIFFPDYSIGSSFTVGAGAAVLAPVPLDQAPTPYLGLQVSASTAPTSGTVMAVLYGVPT